ANVVASRRGPLLRLRNTRRFWVYVHRPGAIGPPPPWTTAAAPRNGAVWPRWAPAARPVAGPCAWNAARTALPTSPRAPLMGTRTAGLYDCGRALRPNR